ncbi:unnamed protein product [Cladocopium goreaui]|uniref:OTU domain-containing protein n=1 Tax=Cladocopium goreaui TaxID=2562237 RepID=A0A9P1C924_9DINO|nr:unnamed protein product [Cladocopium goreaui]
MKTGFVLVIGLVATIWSGTPDDTVGLTSLYEGDSKHGANMQGSLLFQAFHRKVMDTGVETKNSIVYSACVWLLCALHQTRFWRIRTVYKLVGHTHSHCDRVFSRIKASLMGKSYISEDDMKQIIVSTLKSYKMEWDHLHASLDFEALKTLLGLDIHHLRNVHDLEIFRTTGGVFVRWKQYISDELWSRPRLVVAPENIATVAQARPPHVKHKFTDEAKAKFSDFLSKLEIQLGSMNLLDDHVRAGMAWLKQVTQFDTDFTMPVDRMLGDIMHGGAPRGCRLESSAIVPDDMLLLNCPGPCSLVQLGTVGDSDPAMDASCCVGDFVITLNDSKALPFVMGQVVDVDGDSGIVQWWHPGKSKEANLKAGRKKAILDLFGGWQPTTDIPVGELEPLPPSVVSPARIRIWGGTKFHSPSWIKSRESWI